jgi:soluble lytic murein transglycosylase
LNSNAGNPAAATTLQAKMRKILAVLALLSCAAHAATDEALFLEAREAFQRGDIPRLAERAGRIGRDYPLRPYVEYWQLRARLADAAAADVDAYLSANKGTLSADRLRADWLRLLAKNREWTEFLKEYPRLVTEDPELTCFAYQARLSRAEPGVLSQARPLWFTAQVLPEACMPVFQAMFDREILTVEDTWARIRLALESGNLSGAKVLLAYLPAGQRPDARTLETVARRPQRYLEKSPPLKTRAQREVALYALYRTADSLPLLAAERMKRLSGQLSDEEKAYAWAQLGCAAARNLRPEAVAWFKNGGRMNDRQLTWRARAALRAGDWSEVLAAINAMSRAETRWPSWRYWKARSLAALGRQPEADAIYATLSNEFNYYGQLAAEEIGNSVSTVPQTWRAGDDDVDRIAGDPALQRALALYKAGLRYEGALEWQWAIRDYDDKKLLAAAELAQRNEWYERAIDTAERTVLLHDFGLRYPAPYRTLVQEYSRQLDLDEAWVYGLVRQESRFVHTARSSAGASGLMQLMPSTARWAAKRLGMKGHHATLTGTIDTNISLGTYYLRQVMDSVDNHAVLASAGYNAGPRRAREWTAGKPLEGTIYIETIPFPETREYVKKVMANTLNYARLFRQTDLSLRHRLGTIPARATQNN